MAEYNIAKIIEEKRPEWEKLIVDWGYTPEQGKKFAQGYLSKFPDLHLMGKMRALDELSEVCMIEGFRKAGIDENEGLEKYERLEKKLK